jgi:hypothetical protein
MILLPLDLRATVCIPVGPFCMGSPPDQDASFVPDTGHASPDHWEDGPILTNLQDHPAVNYSDNQRVEERAQAVQRELDQAEEQRAQEARL